MAIEPDRQSLLQEKHALLSQIEERCSKAGISVETIKSDILTKSLLISLKCGRDSLSMKLVENKIAAALLTTSFEKFFGISNYQAIWSGDLGLIEAKLSSTHSRLVPPEYLLDRFKCEQIPELDSQLRAIITSESDKFQGIRISIGPATKVFSLIDILQEELFSAKRRHSLFQFERARILTLTILIEGLHLRTHEQASRILENIANSVLFQLETIDNQGLSFYLANRNERPAKLRSLKNTEDDDAKIVLHFPEYQYDSKPMSLYWYASSAEDMPLLQYLAFYQVIESYFPIYTAQQTHNIIKRMIKEPSFGHNLDENISRLIMTIKPYIGKGGYADERASLIATLENCLTVEEIKDFIEADETRWKFFTTKSEWQAIASQRILHENPRAELDKIVSNVALRIYEIRCKIVHTKSSDLDNQAELLLPFSKEAQKLEFDIELIRFVSRKTLIASAKQLSL